MTYEDFIQKSRPEREWYIVTLLQSLNSKLDKLMDPIQQLIEDVTTEETVEKSVVTLLTGYYQQILNTVPGLTDDQKTALENLHNSITADTATLESAITTNTPVAPATTGG